MVVSARSSSFGDENLRWHPRAFPVRGERGFTLCKRCVLRPDQTGRNVHVLRHPSMLGYGPACGFLNRQADRAMSAASFSVL